MTDKSVSPPKRRRGHHEGSGGPRKDGRYEWRVTLPDGRRKSFYGKNKTAAKGKADKALADLDRGVDLSARDVTVKVYLERWLKNIAANRVRPSTLESYSSHVEHHIIPVMGRVKLRNLTPDHVDTMLANMVSDKEKPVSPTTANRVRATLRTALASAVKRGELMRNVAALAEPRREKRQRVTPLEGEQIRALIEFVKDHRYGPLITVAIATGMRQGELLALRWTSDVDLDAGVIYVNHTLLKNLEKRSKSESPEERKDRLARQYETRMEIPRLSKADDRFVCQPTPSMH